MFRQQYSVRRNRQHPKKTKISKAMTHAFPENLAHRLPPVESSMLTEKRTTKENPHCFHDVVFFARHLFGRLFLNNLLRRHKNSPYHFEICLGVCVCVNNNNNKVKMNIEHIWDVEVSSHSLDSLNEGPCSLHDKQNL